MHLPVLGNALKPANAVLRCSQKRETESHFREMKPNTSLGQFRTMIHGNWRSGYFFLLWIRTATFSLDLKTKASPHDHRQRSNRPWIERSPAIFRIRIAFSEGSGRSWVIFCQKGSLALSSSLHTSENCIRMGPSVNYFGYWARIGLINLIRNPHRDT